jgi:hypothetical protein
MRNVPLVSLDSVLGAAGPVNTGRTLSGRSLRSTKSRIFHSFKNMIPRLLRAELSGERPGVKEWP